MNPSSSCIQRVEAQLLLESLKPLGIRTHSRVRDLYTSPDLDATVLAQMVAFHGAGGFLVRALTDAGLECSPELRLQATLIRRRNLMLVAALAEAVAALSATGVRSLSFKGPLLSMVVHGDLGIRPSNDIDLLVPREERSHALAVLESIGFGLDSGVDPRVAASPGPTTQHTGLIRGGVHLELHHQIIGAVENTAQFDAAWSRREEQDVAGVLVAVLGVEDRIFHLSVHGARHHFTCLKWLADLAVLAGAQGIDWERQLIEARRRRAERAFLQGWHHTQRFLDTPLPEVLSKPVLKRRGFLEDAAERSQSLWFPVVETADDRLDLRLFGHRLRLQPIYSRVKTVCRMLFIPTITDFDHYPSIPSKTPIVFNILRPLRLARRTARVLLKDLTSRTA